MFKLYDELSPYEIELIHMGEWKITVTSHVSNHAACNCLVTATNGDKLHRTISYAFLYQLGILNNKLQKEERCLNQ